MAKNTPPPPMSHHSTQMTIVPRSQHYSLRNHSCAFACPVCGKSQRANTNFLGRRLMVCDGAKVSKVRREDWGLIGEGCA